MSLQQPILDLQCWFLCHWCQPLLFQPNVWEVWERFWLSDVQLSHCCLGSEVPGSLGWEAKLCLWAGELLLLQISLAGCDLHNKQLQCSLPYRSGWVASVHNSTLWFDFPLSSERYFKQLSDDLEAYTHHAGRKTVEAADLEVLMRR